MHGWMYLRGHVCTHRACDSESIHRHFHTTAVVDVLFTCATLLGSLHIHYLYSSRCPPSTFPRYYSMLSNVATLCIHTLYASVSARRPPFHNSSSSHLPFPSIPSPYVVVTLQLSSPLSPFKLLPPFTIAFPSAYPLRHFVFYKLQTHCSV
jgi:hypothetical protein